MTNGTNDKNSALSRQQSGLQKLLSSALTQISVTLFLMLFLFGTSALIAYQTGKSTNTPSEQSRAECTVGGCNGELCSDAGSGPDVSICIADPKSECYKKSVCERQANKACGWRQTEEFTACLEKYQTTGSSSQGKFCGGIAGIACPEGYNCRLDGDYPDAGGTCVMKFSF